MSKLNEEGKLIEPSKMKNSKFFDILKNNNVDEIKEFLMKNGKIHPTCPIRKLSEEEIEIKKKELCLEYR